MRLDDKVTLITGSGTGIGRASALLFSKEGAKVIVADINTEEGNRTVAQIREQGKTAIFVQADVSKACDVERMIEETVKNFGRIDILFNNAGIDVYKSILDMSEEEWDRILAVNLKGVFLGCRSALPHMLKQGKGTIVNTASEVGLVGAKGLVCYCSSKGGVIQFTRALALDLADKNIRVNCVCPGATMTPLLEKSIRNAADSAARIKFLNEGVPLGRVGQPEEIARAALFLASDESSFMTGAAVVVDGGWTAR